MVVANTENSMHLLIAIVNQELLRSRATGEVNSDVSAGQAIA